MDEDTYQLRAAEIARIADAEHLADRRASLLETAATMRKVRWVGMAFLLLQFGLYRAPPGLEVPFSRWGVAISLAAVLVGANLGSLAAKHVTDGNLLARLGTVELGIDALVVVAITWLFAFDPTSALWALLVIPVLEGAVRAQLRGALLVWAAMSVSYLARDLWAAEAFDGVPFLPESVSYRMGIVLIVAVTAGLLARNLTITAERLAVQVRAYRDAQTESEHRAQLLRAVATASRHITATEIDEILPFVVEAVVEVGFDAAAVALLDEGWNTFSLPHSIGLADLSAATAFPVQGGPVALALAERKTVVLEEGAAWLGQLGDGGRSVLRGLVVSPVWVGDELRAALLAATRRRRPVSESEIEALELLAAHTGAGMSSAQRFAERKSFQRQLQHAAYHDALTTLPNRASFLERLEEALAREPSTIVGVLFLDLDQFKAINDSLGHDFGDALLVAVADRLRSSVRDQDMISRLGGDEFTVLLDQGAVSTGHAVRVAQRILDALERPLPVLGRELTVSASIGIATGRGGRDEPRDLLRAADLAMYRAKEEGRNRYAIATDIPNVKITTHIGD